MLETSSPGTTYCPPPRFAGLSSDPQSQLGTENPTKDDQARGIIPPGKQPNDMFSYVCGRHSALMSIALEAKKPEREVAGRTSTDMHATVR